MKIIANGKEYDVRDNNYIYQNGKRVSKAQMMADLKEDVRPTTVHNDTDENRVLERAEQNTIKGPEMTYEEKLELWGINRIELERKVGKTAYKPGNVDANTGKQYMGSYLCNINGKAKVIGETTFKGNLQITDVNYKAVGFYMPELFNLASTKQLSEFESVRKGEITLEDLGSVEDTTQFIDIISVWRVKFADLDLVTFLNETTGDFMGTKRYEIYEAEQKARMAKPSMDELFENMQQADIKDQNQGYDERLDTSEAHLEPEYA